MINIKCIFVIANIERVLFKKLLINFRIQNVIMVIRKIES